MTYQVEESIAERRTKVALSVHGVSNVRYTVVCVRKLLSYYVYVQKILEQLRKQYVSVALPL